MANTETTKIDLRIRAETKVMTAKSSLITGLPGLTIRVSRAEGVGLKSIG
jgi:hypothetical protein